ncbi:hypothetical protein FM107_13445 [Sphingobacterium sp. JB170]|nr:hypothetical protein FM107_13445 [Sphingobacterium sp. JB170]
MVETFNVSAMYCTVGNIYEIKSSLSMAFIGVVKNLFGTGALTKKR